MLRTAVGLHVRHVRHVRRGPCLPSGLHVGQVSDPRLTRLKTHVRQMSDPRLTRLKTHVRQVSDPRLTRLKNQDFSRAAGV